MTERLDALTVRETNGKSYWTRIGVAFPAKQGAGWSIMLDAMPASNEGQYKIMLREPLPKDGERQSSSRSQPAHDVDLDDTPF
jgi:hypothetical protein